MKRIQLGQFKQSETDCRWSKMSPQHLFDPLLMTSIVTTVAGIFIETTPTEWRGMQNEAVFYTIGFDGDVRLQQRRQLGMKINAKINQQGDSVTLQCAGKVSAENVSWWYYRCPTYGNNVERIHLSRDMLNKIPQCYELVTARTGAFVSSSLHVKNLNAAEVSGLYFCGLQNPDVTHYFIVGSKTVLGKCFRFESPGALLNTIQSFLGAAEEGMETYEYILKLPRGETGTHDYRIKYTPPGIENSRSPGDHIGLDGVRKLASLHVIKFDESDAAGVKG